MMRATIALLALSLAATAQNPAPAGEGKQLWTAEESHALVLAQQLAAAWRQGQECQGRDWRRGRLPHLTGYSIARFAWRDGEPVITDHEVSRNLLRPGRCLVYLAPAKSHGESRRAFCVRGDGVVAFTDNAERRSLQGDHRIEADAVLGAGGAGDLKEFPLMPARGRDGNLWQPTSMLRQMTVNVMVVDEEGQPMPMHSLHCLPAADGYAVDHALPAGSLHTTFEGSAKLTGMPAKGVGFILANHRYTWIWLDPKSIKVQGRSVRITVPSDLLQRQRMNANESAAIATLKNISSGQSQCRASGVIDGDNDGMGEYGMFAELSGRAALRGTDKHMAPPVLSAAFGNIQGGVASRSGYLFKMFLPGKGGVGVGEDANGGARLAGVDAEKAESLWCCYAWPATVGESGQRAFFINQSGGVLAAPNSDGIYSGAGKAPPATAAYVAATGMAAGLAANRKGADKQKWQVIR